MKKRAKKLVLGKETLGSLTHSNLQGAAAGTFASADCPTTSRAPYCWGTLAASCTTNLC
jgi:hypothetical protein